MAGILPWGHIALVCIGSVLELNSAQWQLHTCELNLHRKCIGVEPVAGKVVSLSDLASAFAKCKSKCKSMSKSKCMQQLYAHCVYGKCIVNVVSL